MSANHPHGSTKDRLLNNEAQVNTKGRDLFSRIERTPSERSNEETFENDRTGLASCIESSIKRTPAPGNDGNHETGKAGLKIPNGGLPDRRTDEETLESGKHGLKVHIVDSVKRTQSPADDETSGTVRKDLRSRIGGVPNKRARTPDQETSNTGKKVGPSPKRHKVDVPLDSPWTRVIASSSETPVGSRAEAPNTTDRTPQRASPKTVPQDVVQEDSVPTHSHTNLVITTDNQHLHFSPNDPMTAPLLPSQKNVDNGTETIRARSASVSASMGASIMPAPAPEPMPTPVKLESAGESSDGAMVATPVLPPLLVRVKILEESLAAALVRMEVLKKQRAKDQEEARSKEDILTDLIRRIESLEQARDTSITADFQNAIARISSLERELRGA